MPSDIRLIVSEKYGQIAQNGGGCCGSGNLAGHAVTIGYDANELASIPEGANLGLGCGSPTSLTMIEPGMTVVDLGSGAGIDCFLAAPRVGKRGRVIGVDMTDAMLDKARAFATEKGYDNVEFRKGFIEELPLDASSVDLVISNCVINLSPDKAQVFREIARVLKPGGKAAISDIVLLANLPEKVRTDIEAYIGCIAGAERIEDYLTHVEAAGLSIEKADKRPYDVVSVLSCGPTTADLLKDMPKDFDAAASVASLEVLVVKPGA